MKQDRNSFKFGKATHQTEDDTFAVFDENTIELGFQEVWENTENVTMHMETPTSVSSGDRPLEASKNAIRLAQSVKNTRDVVFDYVDRFPNSGQ